MSRTTITPVSIRTALAHKRVAFTGKLASMSRAEARERVRQAGGRSVVSINRHTELLVVGMDGWPLLADGRMSNKLQQAERVRGHGRLRICSEDQFLELIGLSERQSELRKSYDVEQVLSLVGIDEATLRRWEALGLVRSHDDQFDFQDLVSLRTIASLIKAGVNPQTIGRSVRRLASILPGTDRPLAQLKVVAEDSGALLAEIDGLLLTPAGQFLMPFDRQEEHDNLDALSLNKSLSRPLRGPPPRPQRSAEEWLEIGCENEDAERWDDALSAYRQALAMQPRFPEAHFNLANVLRAAGRLQAAEERYRVALEQDPRLVEAWFNLADLLDQLHRSSEAIECLREAVRCSPTYADAHFNLAQGCDAAGLRDEAREHWLHYLRLDSSSEWAAIARAALRAG